MHSKYVSLLENGNNDIYFTDLLNMIFCGI